MSSLSSRLGVLGELRGARDAVLFVRVSAFAASVPLLLRLSLPRQAAVLRRAGRRSSTARATIERLPELVGLAHRAWHPLVRPGCLTRGMTLLWFLRRAGHEVELCFGLDVEGDHPEGHCWLMRGGEPLLERADQLARFVEIYRLPPTSA